MSSVPLSKLERKQVNSLRKEIRQMIQLEFNKPGLMEVMMGVESHQLSEQEIEDDLSLGIASYMILDYLPKLIREGK